MRGRLVVLVALTMGLSACGGPPPLSSKFRIETRFDNGEPVSARLLLIGDNQTNNVAGGEHFLSTKLADSLVSVAIRPIQLDFYGQEILGWSLDRQAKGAPIVHLGDATNTSCTLELTRFFKTMERARGEWVMVPGNHDGSYDGNADLPEAAELSNLGITRGSWRSACGYAGTPMDRADFLTSYVRKVFELRPARKSPLSAGELGEGEWSAPDEKGMLRRIHWNIDRGRPWSSFVVQEIDFTNSKSAPYAARGFLLDTNEYDARPTVVPTLTTRNTGLTGEIGKRQADVIDRWITADGEARPTLTTLFGHHPYFRLTGPSQAIVDALRKKTNAVTYVSAHEHLGQYFVHAEQAQKSGGDETWLELNVGSILDSPIEYRTFQIHTDTHAEPRLGIHTLLRRPVEEWLSSAPPSGSPVCKSEWEALPPSEQDLGSGSLEYYLSYHDVGLIAETAMRARLMNVMLMSYARMMTLIPAPADDVACKKLEDEVRAALGAGDLEVKRAAVAHALDNDCDAHLPKDTLSKRRDWALCQAAWASKYEHIGNRAPTVDDWYVTFPRPN